MIAASLYPAFSRNFEDEQDYSDATALAARRASPLLRGLSPSLRWKRGPVDHPPQPPDLPRKKKFKTLVVGVEGAGASFAKKCFGLTEADWIGTLVLPGATAPADASATTGGLGDSLDASDPLNAACNLFRKEAGGKGDGDGDNDGDVAVALCGYRVPPARAQAWARALLDGIDAEVVVALATVGIEAGRSEGWGGARLLATAEAEERAECLEMSRGFQPLRTPMMLTGASAALISYCQRHGRAAMCFAAAERPGRLKQRGVGAERAFSCTRKPLGLLIGDSILAPAAAPSGADEADLEMAVDVASNLYV